MIVRTELDSSGPLIQTEQTPAIPHIRNLSILWQIAQLFDFRSLIFMQDKTPPYYKDIVQNWLNAHFSKKNR